MCEGVYFTFRNRYNSDEWLIVMSTWVTPEPNQPTRQPTGQPARRLSSQPSLQTYQLSDIDAYPGYPLDIMKTACLFLTCTLVLLQLAMTGRLLVPGAIASTILSFTIGTCAYADTLTASSVIQMDKQPKMDSLKDMLFVLKLEKELVEKKDYRAFRSQLRNFPLSDLRTTCRSIKPYLETEKLQGYNNAYSKMIDNVDYMDSLALKRTQSQGAIKEDVDEELLKALDNSIGSFQGMLDKL